MSGTSNFQQFNPGKNNQLTDSEYTADSTRSNGAVSGIASSASFNKMAFQLSTFIAAFASALATKGFEVSDSSITTLATVMAGIVTTADYTGPDVLSKMVGQSSTSNGVTVQSAGHAGTADAATHATSADSATTAGHAGTADSATSATLATTAVNASTTGNIPSMATSAEYIIRATLDGTGSGLSFIAGSNAPFETAIKHGTGDYELIFAHTFSAEPTIIIIPYAVGMSTFGITNLTFSGSSARFNVCRDVGSSYHDCVFSFQAIGQY